MLTHICHMIHILIYTYAPTHIYMYILHDHLCDKAMSTHLLLFVNFTPTPVVLYLHEDTPVDVHKSSGNDNVYAHTFSNSSIPIPGRHNATDVITAAATTTAACYYCCFEDDSFSFISYISTTITIAIVSRKAVICA